jgi:capsular exopolysaccharide synthesis family protein
MSQIDAALKRAAAAGEVPDDGHVTAAPEPRLYEVGPAMLERFALETPPRSQQSPQPPPARVAAPPISRRAPIKTLPPSLEGKLVVSRDIPQVTVEQYRRLGAALHELQSQHGLNTLAVTSALPREGKTLTITNLALTLSESFHRRVLLIDADLRRPSIHEALGIPNGAGFADVERSGDGTLPLVEISPRLSVLTAGKPGASPMAQLTSDRARAIVRDASARFDWVLLDAPPVGLLPDAQLIARLSESVLFVIAAGSTPYSLVQRGIAELGAERIVGTVLNRVQARTLPVTNYYQGYYKADASRLR